MNARLLASIGFKLAGIFAVVHTAPLLQSAIMLPGVQLPPSEEVNPYLLGFANVVPLVGLLAMGGFLFFRSDRIAAHYYGEDGVETSHSARELQAAILSVTGFILIILAVRYLGPALVYAGIVANQDDPFQIANNEWQRERLTRYLADSWGNLLAQVLSLVMGIVLIRQSRRIAGFLQKIGSE